MLTLKQRVDIYVHEQFGNTKRLSEEDKKDIRKFLYKHLKNPERDLVFAQDNRRHSLDSTDDNIPIEHLVQRKDTENELLRKVYEMLNKGCDGCDSKTVDQDKFDVNDTDNESVISEGKGEVDVTTEDPELVTMEMIEARVLEINQNVEDLRNEIKDCYHVLGLSDTCKYPLHDVLESYVEKHDHEKEDFEKMRMKLDRLETQRRDLEVALQEKEGELKQTISSLANATHESDRARCVMKDLEIKCEQLQRFQDQQLEKQQTLITLKSMVNDLSPMRRPQMDNRRVVAFDEVDAPGPVQTEYLQLPDIRASHQQGQLRRSRSRHSKPRKSGGRDRSGNKNHHEFTTSMCAPVALKGGGLGIGNNTGSPWKY